MEASQNKTNNVLAYENTKANTNKKYSNIPRSVWGLGFAILLMAISTAMTFSVSPFFLSKVLGLTMLSIGVIEGITEGIAQVSRLMAGYAGDYFNKNKPALVLGFVLATLSKPFFILANGIGLVVTSKVMERLSNGVIAVPRDAFVAKNSTKEQRGACIGLILTFKTLGCAVGSFLVAGLLLYYECYRTLLWVGFGFCVISTILLIVMVKEHKQDIQKPHIHSEESHKTEKITLSEIKNLGRGYWSFIGVACFFMAARFSDGFLLFRFQELGAPEWVCTSLIGIFNIISALCCYPFGKLSDKINRSYCLGLSFAALIVCNICFVWADGVILGLVGVVLWGVQRGTSQVLFASIIADEVPKKVIGTALGLFYVITGGLAVVSGFVAGYFADISVKYTFMYGLVFSSIAFVLLFVREKFKKKRKQELPAQIESYEETIEKAA